MEEYKPPEYKDDYGISEPSKNKPRKFQAMIYSMGLILAIITFTEFYYGNVLQNQIGDYEKRVDDFEKLRETVLDMEERYTDVWYNLMKADITAALLISDSLITETEATMMIYSQVLAIQNLWLDFEELFLYDYYNDDIEWLFTEGVFELRYNNKDGIYGELQEYFDSKSNLPDSSELDNWELYVYYPDKYFYSKTHSLLVGVMIHPYPVDVYAHIDIFDEYVQKNFVTPLRNAENALILLQISTSSNTVGLLILGFLMDFAEVSKKWKTIYILITMFSMFSGILMTYFVFFD